MPIVRVEMLPGRSETQKSDLVKAMTERHGQHSGHSLGGVCSRYHHGNRRRALGHGWRDAFREDEGQGLADLSFPKGQWPYILGITLTLALSHQGRGYKTPPAHTSRASRLGGSATARAASAPPIRVM